MIKKRVCSAAVAFALSIGMITNVCSAGVSYLPDVTKEMSQPSYWTDESKILMTYEKIKSLNSLTISQSGTNMYDLKNQAETVDGISLNQALMKSAKADVSYYLGWTYIDKNVIATEEDFAEFINNTQNPNAVKEQKTRYGIAVKRTELRAFPTDKPIRDDADDKDFDYQYLSSVRVNEPLVITSVSADGKYYLAKNVCCSGWVPSEDVALCSDKAEWLSAWDISPEKALIVYGDKVYTEKSNTATATSGLMLTMGTVLEQADVTDPNVLIDNRAAYQNYVVWVPVRNSDGSYSKKATLISEHSKVNDGYLPLTKENISKVAFSCLGNTYGWGGSLDSDDCSGYMRNIYKCFGLELARNTTWQTAMPMAKTDMQYMCREERISVLDSLPFGSILYFSGHEMMYLGKDNGKYYVISSISTIMQPENASVRQRVRSMVINTLDIKRANGNSWLDSLTMALVPYQTAENSTLPNHAWYHDGVAFCLKNKLMQGDNNGLFNPGKNITFAEFLQILYNKEGKPEVEVSEAADNKWYDNAVNWAENANMISENEIDPDVAMTREELAEIIYRYAQYKDLDTSSEYDLSAYTDADQISGNMVSAVKYVIKNGIINGKTADLIKPKDNTTRAEVAVILERFANINK